MSCSLSGPSGNSDGRTASPACTGAGWRPTVRPARRLCFLSSSGLVFRRVRMALRTFEALGGGGCSQPPPSHPALPESRAGAAAISDKPE